MDTLKRGLAAYNLFTVNQDLRVVAIFRFKLGLKLGQDQGKAGVRCWFKVKIWVRDRFRDIGFVRIAIMIGL